MNHSVIIPEFIPYEKIRNFIPEVVKIQKGDNVKWINVSKDFHHLYFFGVLSDLSKVEIVEQLQIGPYFGIKDIKFDDVPNRTILAAIELRKIFDDIKNRHLELWNNYFGFNPYTNIDLKCAIHVGDVIFGYWNSPSRVQITAMGKNVNFCSRLEGYANKNQIIISEEVNELVMDKFDTNKLYISEPERMKSFKHIDHVNEIIRPKI